MSKQKDEIQRPVQPITYTPSTPEIRDYLDSLAKTDLGTVPLTQVIDSIVRSHMARDGVGPVR